MKEIIIFVSAATFIAIILEMYRIKRLVKNQAKIILLQQESIELCKVAQLSSQEVISKYAELTKLNDQIIAKFKK